MTATAAGDLVSVVSPDGVPIACWRSGTGPPLVLVHGTGEDHLRWRPVILRLAEWFTVHAVDRRGRQASGDAEFYSVQAEAADVAAVVDHLGGGVSLVAHSYGAICALEAATRTAGVARLVLYEPPIPVEGSRDLSELAVAMRRLIDQGDEEQALGRFLVEVAGVSPAEFDLLRRIPGFRERTPIVRTVAREIEASRDYVFRPNRFRGLRTPTLMLAGGDSPRALRDAVAAVDAALPDSRIEVLAGQSHRAMDLAPKAFGDAVLGFLK